MKTLEYKWSISKARDTNGYNICSLWDQGNKYSCLGGGYDMKGTVFADWLTANYKERFKEIEPINDKNPDGFYGLYVYGDKRYIDGACGLDCMQKIAESIDLSVMRVCNRKGHLSNLIVRDTREG